MEKWGWKREDVLCIFSVNQVDTGVVTFGTHYALGVGISPSTGLSLSLPFVSLRFGWFGCCDRDLLQ